MYKDLVNLNRKSRVENELSIMTQSIVCELAETNKKIGFSANEIAIRLKLVRSNVSKELNCLFGENKAIKMCVKAFL